MSTVTLLSPGTDLVRHVHSLLDKTGSDLANEAVVFQGKRPAHFLRKMIAASQGAACFPPRMFSIDLLVDHLCEHALGIRGPDVEELDAIAMLYGIHRSMDRRLGATAFDTVEAFLPLGAKVFQALEELRMGLVEEGLLRKGLQHSSVPHGESLAAYYASFYETVEEEGCTTQATRFARVAEGRSAWELAEFRTIVVAGFYGFSGAEKLILQRLAELPQSQFVFQDGPGMHEQIRSLGLRVEPAAGNPSTPSCMMYASPNTHGQVLGVNRVLQECLHQEKELTEDTVIVVTSSDALFPLVQWSLPLVTPSEYNISLGYPLRRTPVHAILNNVLDLVGNVQDGKVYLPDYARLLAHPYVKNLQWKGDGAIARTLANTLERWLADHSGWRFLSLDEIERQEGILEDAAAALEGSNPGMDWEDLRACLRYLHTVFVRDPMAATTAGECAARLMAVITAIDEQSSAWRHEYFRSFATAALRRLHDISISRIADIPLETSIRVCAVVRQCLAETSVPFEGTPVRGLQVLGFAETRNLRFRRVIMLDANDDVLPGTRPVDTLLPPPLRRMLGLATPEEWEQQTAYVFHGLVHGAEETHLFYRDDGKSERSRFVEQLLWERQKADRSASEDRSLRIVRIAPRLDSASPAPLEKSGTVLETLARLRLSASAIDCYLACPIRFFYRYLMRLEETTKVDGGLEHADIGMFVHAVLAEIDRGAVGTVLRCGVDRSAEVHRAVDRVSAMQFGETPGVPQWLLKEQAEAHVLAYLAWYDREVLARGDVRLLGIEQAFECTWEGIRIQGRADRIEQRGQTTVILDFKTGGDLARLRFRAEHHVDGDRASWSAAVGSFQLPMYLLLYAAREHVPLETLAAGYIALGAPEFDENSISWLFDSSAHDPARWATLTGVLRSVVNEMLDPHIPFAPADDLQETCPGCPFTVLCGTTWVGNGNDRR